MTNTTIRLRREQAPAAPSLRVNVEDLAVPVDSPIGELFRLSGTAQVVIRRANGDETTWTRVETPVEARPIFDPACPTCRCNAATSSPNNHLYHERNIP